MSRLLCILSLAALTACGADGAPETPVAKAAPQTGLTLSGCAEVGITTGPPTIGGPARC
jgi:hypothetical protein